MSFSSSIETVLSLDERWARTGRGYGIEFFALDSEVIEFLAAASRIQPDFTLVTFDLGDSIDSGFAHPFTSLPDLRRRGAWDFWLWSPTLDPDLPAAVRSVEPYRRRTLCGVNGLIGLQHGGKGHVPGTGRQAIRPSDLGWIDAVASLDTFRQVRHEANRKPFEAIRRAIRRALACTTITEFPIGQSESKAKRMTKAAADVARLDPLLFTERPATCK
jgi:hypothetical protein